MVDSCLDLQSEAKRYDDINLIIHKKKKNELNNSDCILSPEKYKIFLYI